MGKRKMTRKDEVRAQVIHARCVPVDGRMFQIVRGNSYSIGYGKTREAAWADAARRLNEAKRAKLCS